MLAGVDVRDHAVVNVARDVVVTRCGRSALYVHNGGELRLAAARDDVEIDTRSGGTVTLQAPDCGALQRLRPRSVALKRKRAPLVD